MKKIITLILSLLITVTAAATPVSAAENLTLEVSADSKSYKISDSLYGAFIEDISYACDGGLVSNLVNNNSFEYEFNNVSAWQSSLAGFEVSTENSLNSKNPTYAVIDVDGKGTLTNTGYTELYKYKTYDRDESKAAAADMGFKENVKYDFSCYLYNEDYQGTISVYLDSPKNKNNVIQLDISACGNAWRQLNATLTSAAREDGGLTIEFNGTGTVYLDFVTLVPENSYGYGTQEWKYTTLRNDLYTALEQLSPSFIRFPGGCLAEGDSLDNLYNWKNTIGPLEERKQTYNLWRDDFGRDYINTNAMGYHEYFQLCRDLNAEAVPVVNVGLTCQGRNGYDDYVAALEKISMTDEEWQTYLTEKRNYDPDDTQARDEFTKYIDGLGINSREDFEAYLDTIALKPGTSKWDAYVQDVLDLIEYANGDANTTYWGALRSANGSAEPFNIKYIALGNENWGEIYQRNFEALYKAVKEAYPEITVISSAGTYLSGDAYDYNWSWISENYADTIVDEHYYTTDAFLLDANGRYDSFDREGPHVFIGEYAATSPGFGTIQTKSTIFEAAEEASYLTGVERNGDVVEMASYAPTFAKVNSQCWNINLIWFDSQEVVLTPSYYTQMLFANNIGNKYLESTFANSETEQNGVYQSVTVDDKNQTAYIKLVNTSGEKQTVDVSLNGFENINKVSQQSVSGSYKTACNEIGQNTTYPVEKDLKGSDKFSVELNKYDVTVIRVAYGGNDGTALYTLPDFINTMTVKTSTYIPTAVKVAIPCSILLVVVAVAVMTVVHIVMSKRKIK